VGLPLAVGKLVCGVEDGDGTSLVAVAPLVAAVGAAERGRLADRSDLLV
jgi:hypothetical protein